MQNTNWPPKKQKTKSYNTTPTSFIENNNNTIKVKTKLSLCFFYPNTTLQRRIGGVEA